jgi:hypothetical protein
MMRSLTAVGAMLGVLLAAPLAEAQGRGGEGFGERGQFIVGVDRLFDLFQYTQTSFDAFMPQGGDTKTVTTNTQTSVGFLWGSTWPSTNETFYTIPRLGFDYTIVNNVTLGGELIAYFTLGGSSNLEHDRGNGTTVTDHNGAPGYTALGFAVRGGYILSLNDNFALWLRGGFSDYVATQKTTNTIANITTEQTTGSKQFALDIDPQFVWTPMRHVGFTAGITADLPIGGGYWQNTVISQPNASNTTNLSGASSFAFVGITIGTLVWF